MRLRSVRLSFRKILQCAFYGLRFPEQKFAPKFPQFDFGQVPMDFVPCIEGGIYNVLQRKNLMNPAFGILGMTFGTISFVLATEAVRQIAKPEAEFKRRGIIEPEFRSDK